MPITIDELHRSKRRTVQLSITNDARLVIRAPLRMPVSEINRFVESKAGWIREKKELILKRRALVLQPQFLEGSKVIYLGSYFTLSFVPGINRPEIKDDLLLFPQKHREHVAEALVKWYQREARSLFEKRVACYAAKTGLMCSSIRLSGARKRWGSCSSKNSLNFSWRLILAAPAAVDYVIVHELCHILHKNHSKRFWQAVETILPDYKSSRRWLREHQGLLDLFSR